MKIAIVILNWNSKELLEKFLPKIVMYSKDAALYLADNASTDDSVFFVSSSYPEITILQNKENKGYAGGYNEVLKQIDEDVYCLLNTDVEVTKGWLNPILEHFKKTTPKECAVIQPKIRDYNNKEFFEYAGAAGGFIDKFGYPFCKGRLFNTIEKDTNQYNTLDSIFWASGACMFIRANVFKTLGGFDETFFAHMEEIDLCWRLHNLGYKIDFIPESVVYHIGGSTLNSTSPKKTYLNFRNSLFALVKNADGNLPFLVFVRLLLDGVAGIKFLFEPGPKHTLAILKAHFAFYKSLPTLLNKRKQIKPKRNYYTTKSIVWSYFVRNKSTFDKL